MEPAWTSTKLDAMYESGTADVHFPPSPKACLAHQEAWEGGDLPGQKDETHKLEALESILHHWSDGIV